MATPFECSNPSVRAARQILLDAIASDHPPNQLSRTDEPYSSYVEVVGNHYPGILAFTIQDAFWQLLVEGILSPGMDSHNTDLPWFHVTEYGRTVLEAGPAHPHDPDRFLERITERVPNIDPTVHSYLSESLTTFTRGNLVSSAVTLGIAAERAFLLLCEAVEGAIQDTKEKAQFTRILERFPMKPKLDWVSAKFQTASVRRLPDFPDNAQIAILSVYDFLRVQRNELGHPSPAPPSIDREDQFSNLQVFSRFYETVERIRSALAEAQI